MFEARSINQNPQPDALPDLRNLGVILRVVLTCNGAALLLVVWHSHGWSELLPDWLASISLLEPILLCSLLALYVAQPFLTRLSGNKARALIVATPVLVGWLVLALGAPLYVPAGESLGFHALRIALACSLASLTLLAHWQHRQQVLSPALHEARLQALRARIRPHFLFNTLNSVLAIVRQQPKRAETALEDLADLFRMAMDSGQDLVPLRREIELAQRYLALERLRLDERLQVEWKIAPGLDAVLIPPLLLQPLLENAVYHGIEPLPEGGAIHITLRPHLGDLVLEIVNPCPRAGTSHGQHLALANIRERLALLFDVEASLQAGETADGFFSVRLALPLRGVRP